MPAQPRERDGRGMEGEGSRGSRVVGGRAGIPHGMAPVSQQNEGSVCHCALRAGHFWSQKSFNASSDMTVPLTSDQPVDAEWEPALAKLK